jgi:U1 small nuclear ribonucleoprotein
MINRKHAERKGVKLAKHVAKWDPKAPNERATEDAYKTLFVGRLAFDVTEDDLKKEFEFYGAIKRVRLVKSKKTGKSRGYAFVEFEHSADLKGNNSPFTHSY